MKTAISSFLGSPRGLCLLLTAGATAVCVPLMSKQLGDSEGKGPQHDLVFGVYVYDPAIKTTLSISPYIIGDSLRLDVRHLPPNEGTTNAWIKLYRYHCKTGHAEQLPLYGPATMPVIRGREQFNLSEAWHFRLKQIEKSPDGYALAEPNWVKAGFLENLTGNIMLLTMFGKSETMKVREQYPRLSNGSESILMKAKEPLFANEAENAFSLGWVVADGPAETRKKP